MAKIAKVKILRQRLTEVKERQNQLLNEHTLKNGLEAAIINLAQFKSNISARLKNSDWETKRMIINLLIKRVEIGIDNIKVVFKINLPNSIENDQTENLPYCWGSPH